ncbi:MAG: hypothetical protein QOI26_1204, partial [Pseudonocardiales bacterium]|nr:hypothetical protein [Pseudonocardiales bacterium]
DRPGHFFAPTILSGVSDGVRVVDEEQFGPVLPVIGYRDIDEAVRRANGTDYGLTASVWSPDLDRAAAVAARLEAGQVSVNAHAGAVRPDLPFSGHKESGIGVENGLWGLYGYTDVQALTRPAIGAEPVPATGRAVGAALARAAGLVTVRTSGGVRLPAAADDEQAAFGKESNMTLSTMPAGATPEEPAATGIDGASPTAPPAKDPTSAARLADLADYVVPFTLRAICDLRIADHLADGPRTVEQLAQLTGSHALSLHRALRALASRDIFTEVEPGVFGLTALAEPLRSDHPASLRDAYPLIAGDIRAWSAFDHTLRTGEPAFDHVHGQGYWEHLAEHPRDSALFDASQRSVTRRELRAILPAYDWSVFGAIVDVGGGNGAFLAGILDANPSVRGILFDQPHVVAAARSVLVDRGVVDRCEVVGGDFLESVPAGGDAYLLKRVLYAWNDEQAVAMLRAIRAGMHADSRLLLLEPVLEPGNEFDWGKLYDVLLLVMAGGGGRSLEGLQELFAKADLELVRVIRTRMLPIVEARPI